MQKRFAERSRRTAHETDKAVALQTELAGTAAADWGGPAAPPAGREPGTGLSVPSAGLLGANPQRPTPRTQTGFVQERSVLNRRACPGCCTAASMRWRLTGTNRAPARHGSGSLSRQEGPRDPHVPTFASLSFNSLICKMEMTTMPIPWGC